FTRVGGYIFITRMKRIPPRAEAALNAVPAAVLTTLVAPAAVTGGFDVSITMAIALVLGLRIGLLPMLAAGWLVVTTLRHFLGCSGRSPFRATLSLCRPTAAAGVSRAFRRDRR